MNRDTYDAYKNMVHSHTRPSCLLESITQRQHNNSEATSNMTPLQTCIPTKSAASRSINAPAIGEPVRDAIETRPQDIPKRVPILSFRSHTAGKMLGGSAINAPDTNPAVIPWSAFLHTQENDMDQVFTVKHGKGSESAQICNPQPRKC